MGTGVASVLSAMFASASAVSMLAIALDHTPGAERAPALAVGGLAVVTALALIVHLRRTGRGLSRLTVHGVLSMALAVVAVAVWCGHGGTTALAGLGYFAWLPLVAFAYLPRREAVPYLVAAGALCIALVLATVAVTPIGCALDVVGTIAAGSLTAGYFRSLLLRTSIEDHLTGLPNRQALPAILEREAAGAARTGAPLAIAVLDLDRFKEVNDSAGHHAGDSVLRAAADTWSRILDPEASLARYGGDEFVAVMPGLSASRAAIVIDDLRRAGQHPCSAGVAEWRPGEPVDTALARADAALYRAKREGRARVVQAPDTAPPAVDGPAVDGPDTAVLATHGPGGTGDDVGPPRAPAPAAPAATMATALRTRAGQAGFGRPSTTTDRVVRLVRVMGMLYVAAGAIYLPQITFDPIPGVRVAPAAAITATALVVGAAVVAEARWLVRHVGMTAVHIGLVAGIVAVAAGSILARSGPEGIVALGIFAWIWMYAFTVFSWRLAAFYCALGSAFTIGYVVSTVSQNTASVAILTVYTAAGIGVLVGHLNQVLQYQARIDAVTGLPNRAALERELARSVAASTRAGTPLAVAVIDLDHFKDVNDSSGHHAGDALLRRFADEWQRGIRPTDLLFRYGGDEFVLLLPGCALDEAAALVERLRAAAPGPCSIGVVERRTGDTADSLVARADSALYAAKQAGRDQVATSGDGPRRVLPGDRRSGGPE